MPKGPSCQDKKCLCAGINLQKHRLALLGLFIQIHRGENLNENKYNGVLSLSAEAVCDYYDYFYYFYYFSLATDVFQPVHLCKAERNTAGGEMSTVADPFPIWVHL